MEVNCDRTSTGDLFIPAGFVVVRATVLPLDTLEGWSGVDNGRDSSVPEADSHSAGEVDESTPNVRTWLQGIIAAPIIQEAILVASPDLYRALSHYEDTVSKKAMLAQASALRYVIRMASRPTPYGLFAGVGLARIGEHMDIHIASREQHRKWTRPSMQWLIHMVHELEQRPEVIRQLHYFANPALFIIAGRVCVPRLDLYKQRDYDESTSVPATALVRRALALARHGDTIGVLYRNLRAERPEEANSIWENLEELRQKHILINNLRPPLTSMDPAQYLLDRLLHLDHCDDIRTRVYEVLNQCKAYDDRPIGKGLSALKNLHRTMTSSDSGVSYLPDTRLALAITRHAFSASVASEVARAAEVMFQLSNAAVPRPHLVAYRRRFIERYGSRREVPLLEMLDEDVGIGPPATYRASKTLITRPRNAARDRLLCEIASTALLNKRLEIELDDATVRALSVHRSWKNLLPESLELYVSIAAASQAAINDGNYSIVIGPRTGVIPAGRSLGRYSDILGEESVGILTRLARDEEEHLPGWIFAELVYMPTGGEGADIAIRPAIRDYEILVGASSGTADANTIPITDLVVGVGSGGFYARSLSRGMHIATRNNHLLRYGKEPYFCRFLKEISTQDSMSLASFDWGAAAHLPFVPRLRVGRAVVSTSEWHLPKGLAEAGDTTPSDNWHELVQEWRRMWGVPRHVYMTERENRLLLDLENPLCTIDLARECRRHLSIGSAVSLQEMYPGFQDAWTTGEQGRFMTEFIVPLIRSGEITAATSRLTHVTALKTRMTYSNPLERLRLPGSDWLYAKIYCSRLMQDQLLAGPIRAFTKQVQQDNLAKLWFFTRYIDPDPHIRLRFQGDPQILQKQAVPALTRWCEPLVETGTVQRLVLDSYDREIERYGGLWGIAVAEHIFAADSAAIVEISAVRTHSPACSQVDLAILTIDDLVTSLGLNVAGRHQLYTKIRQQEGRAFTDLFSDLQRKFHTYRSTARRIVWDRSWLRGLLGGDEIDQALKQRAATLRPISEELSRLFGGESSSVSRIAFLSSCVHMHFNRLLGLNPALEVETFYYLERTLESLDLHPPDRPYLA